MSYCRFGEADVYVFMSNYGLECCMCPLQEREYVEDGKAPVGFWLKPVGEEIQTTFETNEEMIEHLNKHREAGHYIPEHVFERLRDPEDAAYNQEILAETKRREEERGEPQSG